MARAVLASPAAAAHSIKALTKPSSCLTSACSASTTIFLVNLPWYDVTLSLRRFFLDVPPLNLLAISWLLATALSADVNSSVVGLTRTVFPSLSSYHPSSSPSLLFSISPSPDIIPSVVFNTCSAFTGIIICIMTSSNKSNACSGRP
jgi:hypothetical protein